MWIFRRRWSGPCRCWTIVFWSSVAPTESGGIPLRFGSCWRNIVFRHFSLLTKWISPGQTGKSCCRSCRINLAAAVGNSAVRRKRTERLTLADWLCAVNLSWRNIWNRAKCPGRPLLRRLQSVRSFPAILDLPCVWRAWRSCWRDSAGIRFTRNTRRNSEPGYSRSPEIPRATA